MTSSMRARRTAPRGRPSFGRMLRRALLLRCAHCGGKRAFLLGWFHTRPRCATCGLAWRRGQVGFELGAAAINAVVTIGALLVGIAVGIAITYPDVAVVPLVVVLGVAAVVLPVGLFPFTYTIWFAVELAMERPSDDELAAASEAIRSKDAVEL